MCDKVIFLSERIDIFCFWPHFYLIILKSGMDKGDFLEWQDPWRKFLIWRDIGKTVEVWETEIALGTFGTKAYHPKSTQYHPRSTHKYAISSQDYPTSSQVYPKIFHIIPSLPTNIPYHPKSTHKYSISSQVYPQIFHIIPSQPTSFEFIGGCILSSLTSHLFLS